MAGLRPAVRAKPPGLMRLAGRFRTAPTGRPATLNIRSISHVRLKTLGRPGAVGRNEHIRAEIAVLPDAIAFALAQLVRDRWAAERRGHDDGRGRLRVMVTGSSE
jgi:hypothetical protein